jgi:hypothetical protein
MAIGALTEQLRTENADTPGIVESISGLSDQVKIGFDGLISSVKNMNISSSGMRLKIPGIDSLVKLFTDNIFVNTIKGFYNQAVSFITSPFRLLQASLSGIKDTFQKGLSFLGGMLKKPFQFLMGLFGSKDKNITLNAILDEVINTKNAILDYVQHLKRNELDKLEDKLENKPVRGIPREGVNVASSGSQSSNSISFIPMGLLRALALPVTGFLIAATATFTGWDTEVRALRMIGTKSFARIGSVITSIGGLLNKTLNSFTSVFSRAANLNAATVGRNALGRFTPKVATSGLSKVLGALNGPMEKIKGFVGGFLNFLKPLGKFASAIMKPLMSVGRLLKGIPFLAPLIALFDFIGGALKGFKETQGSLTQKLLGGLEGGFLGIVKGITKTVDLLVSWITFIPRKILGFLGFDKFAEALGNLNITKLVDPIWKGIKFLFTSPAEAFKMLGSYAKDIFLLQTTKIGNSIEEMFYGAIKFFKNIPDRLAILASKLSFSVPKFEVPLPKFLGGGKFTIMDGFTVGLGSQEGANRARASIASREQAFAERVSQNRGETSAVLERLSEISKMFNNRTSSGNAVVQTNVDSRSSNSSTTVLSSGSLPSTVDREDVNGPL